MRLMTKHAFEADPEYVRELTALSPLPISRKARPSVRALIEPRNAAMICGSRVSGLVG